MTRSFANYYGLVFGCPVGKELHNCGYRIIRQMKTKDRIAYYETMAENQKDSLIKKHQKCLSVRENKTLFHESQ